MWGAGWANILIPWTSSTIHEWTSSKNPWKHPWPACCCASCSWCYFILIMIQVEFKTHVTGLMVQMQNQYMGWLLLSWWFSHGGSLMVVRSGFLSRFLSRFHLCKVLFLVVVPKGYWIGKKIHWFPVHASLDMSCWRRAYHERLPWEIIPWDYTLRDYFGLLGNRTRSTI